MHSYYIVAFEVDIGVYHAESCVLKMERKGAVGVGRLAVGDLPVRGALLT